MFNGVVMLISMYCYFVLIRFWSDLKLVSKALLLLWTVLITSSWLVGLEIGKILLIKGNKVLGSCKGDIWGNRRENKTMKKFNRSCKPVLICYGKQFVIGRVSLFVFCRGVTRGTCRLLLTTKT